MPPFRWHFSQPCMSGMPHLILCQSVIYGLSQLHLLQPERADERSDPARERQHPASHAKIQRVISYARLVISSESAPRITSEIQRVTSYVCLVVSRVCTPEVCDNHVAHEVGVGLLARDAEGAGVENLVQALLRQRLAVQLREHQRVRRLQEAPPMAQERLQLCAVSDTPSAL